MREIEEAVEKKAKKRLFASKKFKYLAGGTILFFAIKGVITTSLIVGALVGMRGCLSGG